MKPQTPAQLTATLTLSLIARAYGDITTAARRSRLTEHDIAVIERKVLDILRHAADFAQEFETFEAEPAKAAAIKDVEHLFAATRAGRIKQIHQK